MWKLKWFLSFYNSIGWQHGIKNEIRIEVRLVIQYTDLMLHSTSNRTHQEHAMALTWREYKEIHMLFIEDSFTTARVGLTIIMAIHNSKAQCKRG